MDFENLFLRFFGMSRYSGNIERIQEESWALFRSAKKDLKIVAGELNNDFYADQQTLESLAEARRRGVQVKIVHGPERNEKTIAVLKENGAELAVLPARPRIHFTVADGKNTKVEEFHLPGDRNRVYYVKYNTSYLGRRLEEEFAQLETQASEE
ncbi:MAG: hypothetical protein M1570_06890 [Chloroflexi bacterium]|nr:hypothetical protein [Chloroflexota bacterium]